MFDHINQKRYLPFLTTKALKVRNMLARVRLKKKKNTSFQPIENFPSIMQTKEIGQYLSCGGGGRESEESPLYTLLATTDSHSVSKAIDNEWCLTLYLSHESGRSHCPIVRRRYQFLVKLWQFLHKKVEVSLHVGLCCVCDEKSAHRTRRELSEPY